MAFDGYRDTLKKYKSERLCIPNFIPNKTYTLKKKSKTWNNHYLNILNEVY